MSEKNTKFQGVSINKNMEDKHSIKIIVTTEKAEEYKRLAKAESKNLTQFIVDD